VVREARSGRASQLARPRAEEPLRSHPRLGARTRASGSCLDPPSAARQSGPGNQTTRIIEHPRPLITATLRIKNKKQAATINTLRTANKALAARNKALAAANRALEATLNGDPRSGPGSGCSSYMFCSHEDDCLYWGINCDVGPSSDNAAPDQLSNQSPASEPGADTSPASASSDAAIPIAPERPAPPSPPADNGPRTPPRAH
jgi:hypothetical protein